MDRHVARGAGATRALRVLPRDVSARLRAPAPIARPGGGLRKPPPYRATRAAAVLGSGSDSVPLPDPPARARSRRANQGAGPGTGRGAIPRAWIRASQKGLGEPILLRDGGGRSAARVGQARRRANAGAAGDTGREESGSGRAG